MKRILWVGLPLALAVVVNILWGSVISWMLTAIIIACLLFFVAKFGFEDYINRGLIKMKRDEIRLAGAKAAAEKGESRLAFSLLTIVFVTLVIGLFFVMNPSGKQTWYSNIDYHGISNTGITFPQQLKLSPIVDGETDFNAHLSLSPKSQDETEIVFDNFFSPVVETDADGSTHHQLNRIFDQPLTDAFTLSNSQSSLQVNFTEQHHNIFMRLFGKPKIELDFELKLHCSDPDILNDLGLRSPFDDVIHFKHRPIERGLSLFDLFLDNPSFESAKDESYQVLEAILNKLGNTYFLADRIEKEKSYLLFPAKSFFDNQFKLSIRQQVVAPKLQNLTTIANGHKFFVGFNNWKRPLHIDHVNQETGALSTSGLPTLVFDYPNTYLLQSPDVEWNRQEYNRFLTNDFGVVMNATQEEGFYFPTYGLKASDLIRGNIRYVSGKPGTGLNLKIKDLVTGKEIQPTTNNLSFLLKGAQGSNSYVFQIKDFSQNGFTYAKIVLYLGLSYLAFVFLILFFPGRKLSRIEPVVLSVILTLLGLRFLMFWRVATFPPLNDITKFELENTLFNFDFNMGIHWPIPFTLIITLVFVFILSLYRRSIKKGKPWNFTQFAPLKTDNVSTINKSYAILFIGLFVAFAFNEAILHIFLLTRIISIVLPLIFYWYFSKLANQNFTVEPLVFPTKVSAFKRETRAYFYYLFHNPTFVLTVITLMFFALADRGFAVLFALFILLKNILINFLKKPLNPQRTQLKKMFYKPNNFWIYAFTALLIYLVILSFKSLFYYLLLYRLWAITAVLLIGCLIIYLLYHEQRKLRLGSLSVLGLWLILMAVPFSRNKVDHKIMDTIKHVQYRASIITQPIGELMQQNPYTSFSTRKIIETAENQWFINSYVSKQFDPSRTINLRAHSRVGVDYSTQTRDVVVARYLIGEMGNLVMYLILLLFLLPLIFYLIAYRVHLVPIPSEPQEKDLDSYAGLLPLVILFTLALFVWLTATNRFVFFGQDFPFLSLTSRISVLLPLTLFGLTLIQEPTALNSFKINLRNSGLKYLLFFGVIAAFALTTIKQNELNNKNFTVVMEGTQQAIEGDFNTILQNIQDSLELKGIHPSYASLIKVVGEDKRFDELRTKDISDNYTKSIFDQLIQKPSSALQLNNPLFIVYNNGRYKAVYNQNLYLELPPIEDRNVWNGSLTESLEFEGNASAFVAQNGGNQIVQLPYYANFSGIQTAVLPANWFKNRGSNKGLIAMNGANSAVFVVDNHHHLIKQVPLSFARNVRVGDLVKIQNSNATSEWLFKNTGHQFALNKWVNNSYRTLFPQGADNFWVYHFANSVKAGYSQPEKNLLDVPITLDYDLITQVQRKINDFAAISPMAQNNKRFNFSVITADGDGNIRLMADYVTGRKTIDPNNQEAIFALQQKRFFYSNAKNERDQWGNRNLLNLYLGMGSSIKPLAAALVASQVNAGWENLEMSNPPAEVTEYAGWPIKKPWSRVELYPGKINLVNYIEKSSNFYQSLIVFLGSYSKEAFRANETYSLKNILTPNAGSHNSVPQLTFRGSSYHLPNYNQHKGNWPRTEPNNSKSTFFGNPNSVLAEGFYLNGNLNTQNALSTSQDINDKANFVDTAFYHQLEKTGAGLYSWGFPEASSFLQSQRSFKDMMGNFNLGLKTVTLGGYPYQVTPFKMLEMYLSLFNQNRDFHLGVMERKQNIVPWVVDESWPSGSWTPFLSNYIFNGMHQVIYGSMGTAAVLSGTLNRPGLYFYGKTGTINEQGSGIKSSRRLVIIASDKDLQKPENIGHSKLYGWYFVTDNTQNFDWNMVKNLLEQTMESNSFKNYFKE